MTSRELVEATIARRETSRVPLGLYAVDHDTVSRVIGRPTYVRNKVETQIAFWEGRRDEVVESWKHDSVEFFRKIDCADLILFKEAMLLPPKDYTPKPPRKIADNTWEMPDGRVFKANPDANDIMCVKQPDRPPKEWSIGDFEDAGPPPVPDESEFEAFDHLLNELGDERYIACRAPIRPMPMLGSFEDAMMIYALQPDVIHAANRQMVRRGNAQDQVVTRPGVAGMFAEHDMAGTNGPFISPDMWREMCLPYVKERVQHLKQYTSQVGLHCCGMTMPLMDMFIEAGIDYYQSLQTTAGMDLGVLKEKFGDDLTFWGGIPLENLIDGTPEDVRRDVRNAMRKGTPGGGFILGPSHSIAYGTKYDNFMAMLDEFVNLRDRN